MAQIFLGQIPMASSPAMTRTAAPIAPAPIVQRAPSRGLELVSAGPTPTTRQLAPGVRTGAPQAPYDEFREPVTPGAPATKANTLAPDVIPPPDGGLMPEGCPACIVAGCGWACPVAVGLGLIAGAFVARMIGKRRRR